MCLFASSAIKSRSGIGADMCVPGMAGWAAFLVTLMIRHDVDRVFAGIVALSSTLYSCRCNRNFAMVLCSLVFFVVLHIGTCTQISHCVSVPCLFCARVLSFVRAAPACGGCRAVGHGNMRGCSAIAEAHDPGPGTCTRSQEGHVNRDLGHTAKERWGVLLRLRAFCWTLLK